MSTTVNIYNIYFDASNITQVFSQAGYPMALIQGSGSAQWYTLKEIFGHLIQLGTRKDVSLAILALQAHAFPGTKPVLQHDSQAASGIVLLLQMCKRDRISLETPVSVKVFMTDVRFYGEFVAVTEPKSGSSDESGTGGGTAPLKELYANLKWLSNQDPIDFDEDLGNADFAEFCQKFKAVAEVLFVQFEDLYTAENDTTNTESFEDLEAKYDKLVKRNRVPEPGDFVTQVKAAAAVAQVEVAKIIREAKTLSAELDAGNQSLADEIQTTKSVAEIKAAVELAISIQIDGKAKQDKLKQLFAKKTTNWNAKFNNTIAFPKFQKTVTDLCATHGLK